MHAVRRFTLGLCCAALVLGAACSVAGAQTLQGLLPQASAGPSFPSDVRQEGLYLTAPVVVDGVPVLRVAESGSDLNTALAVEARAQAIDATIAQILAVTTQNGRPHTEYDPKTFKVEIVSSKDQALLQASDARHGAIPLLTVTSVDSEYRRQSVETLARSWQAMLQRVLVTALQKRQPGVIVRNYDAIVRVGAALVAATLLVWAFCGWLGRLIRRLEKRVEAGRRAIGEANAGAAARSPDVRAWQLRFAGMVLRAARPEQRLGVLRATRASAVLLIVLAWFIACTSALLLFPATTFIGYTIVRHVLNVAIIWIAALLLSHISDLVVGRLAASAGGTPRAGESRSRRLLRVPTITHAIDGFVTFLIVFIAVLTTLGQLGISTGSVLTIGGLVALGVSLAAQNLVRDVMNGFLVLIEDQFVVGDYVTINATSGLVEYMTLRVVQIRDSDGNLVTIPYSTASLVINASRNWSRVDYTVAVAVETDVPKALKLLRETVTGVAQEERWRSAVIDAAEIVGVDSMWRDGIVLRVSMKTAPLRQFELRRALNERVLAAFSKAGIKLGIRPGDTAVPAPPAL